MSLEARFLATPASTRIRLNWQNWWQMYRCWWSPRMNRPESIAISFQAASIIKTDLQRGHCQPALAVTTDAAYLPLFLVPYRVRGVEATKSSFPFLEVQVERRYIPPFWPELSGRKGGADHRYQAIISGNHSNRCFRPISLTLTAEFEFATSYQPLCPCGHQRNFAAWINANFAGSIAQTSILFKTTGRISRVQYI